MADSVTTFLANDKSNVRRDLALAKGGVPNAVENKEEALEGEDELLDVADLVKKFEESESASYIPRQLSQRDRDYVDNKQLTDEEVATLEKRGQPPSVDNRIKTKVDYLVGFEKQQRVNPKVRPRTPKHDADADSATEALRYVTDTEDYDQKRSRVWRNMLVEGAGGIAVSVEPEEYGDPMQSTAMTPLVQEMCIKIEDVAWDRMFWDPHSSKSDFSDANYLGIVIWMDLEDAKRRWHDAEDALESTMSSAPSTTYDDKPKWTHWADRKRKRVRVCQIWIKRGDDWHFAEFTKGGILKAGQSPHKDDKGRSDCELVFQSAYVDRDNNRYGLIREMIPLQDEINKRRSKMLHILSSNQTTYEDGAIEDIQKFRAEKARPDGTMKVAPGALRNGAIMTETRTDMATGHFQLLQEAKNSIDLKGPNATEMGDKTGGSSAASGRAIIASQQGGMTQMGDLMDNLRHLDRRVFRMIWNRIRQYWTAPKWVRVTDDEQNIKWLGLNIDPQEFQQFAQQDPEGAQRVQGVIASVAELDCDIIIEVGPDGTTPQLEQFQTLTELKKFDAGNEIPFRAILSAAPNLKDKQRFLEAMDKRAEELKANPPPPDPKVALMQAELQMEQQRGQAEEQRANQKQALDQQSATFNQGLAMKKAQDDAALKRQVAADEIELKRLIAAEDARIEQDKLDQQHQHQVREHHLHIETERQKASVKAEGAKNISTAKSSGSMDAVKEIAAAVNAPKHIKVIRDESGLIAGAVTMPTSNP